MDSIQLSWYISISISLIAFAIASVSDLRTREVSDKLWFAYAPIGLALTIYRVLENPHTLILTTISIGLSIVLAFALSTFGFSGGADAKALISLSVTLPLPPAIGNPILGFAYPFFPIVVTVTTYITSLSTAFWLCARNMILFAKLRSRMFNGLEKEPAWKKGLALVTGFPAGVSELKSRFYLYPMERVVEEESGPRRTLLTYPKLDTDRDRAVSEFLESIKRVGSPDTVWVTPGIPLLLFMLFGLLIGLTIGDPFSTHLIRINGLWN